MSPERIAAPDPLVVPLIHQRVDDTARDKDSGAIVDTDNVSETVSVQHETANVTREPITDANRDKAIDGPEITAAEHEITLTAEEPVVEKRTVARERVGMDKETITKDQTVSEDLRKERIDVEGDVRR